MAPTGERRACGQGGRPGRLVPAGAALALFLALGLAGCSGLHKQDAEDPLVGPGPKGLRAAPATTTKTQSPVPPPPVANSSASTADLAAGQLAGGRPLGIDDRGGGWQGVGRDGRPVRGVSGDGGLVPVSGGVVLQRPEPLPPADGPSGLTPVPAIIYGQQLAQAGPGPQPGGPSPADRLQQLQDALTARGVIWQRQEVTRDGVRVICAVPDRANPGSQRIYDATARDAVAALEALLAKIDQGR